MISVKEELLDAQLDELTFNELEDMLRSHNLPVYGGRNELVDRLREHVHYVWSQPRKARL